MVYPWRAPVVRKRISWDDASSTYDTKLELFLFLFLKVRSRTLLTTSASFTGLTAAKWVGASNVLQRLVALLKVGLFGKEITVPLAQLFDFWLSRFLRSTG